jgi:hypothetical protein
MIYEHIKRLIVWQAKIAGTAGAGRHGVDRSPVSR